MSKMVEPNWIDSSVSWLKETILLEKKADNKQETVKPENKQEQNGEEEIPDEMDSHIAAIHVPGVWKQDPNEIRWADLETKKKKAEVIKMICTLK
jgi:hypothetical protein